MKIVLISLLFLTLQSCVTFGGRDCVDSTGLVSEGDFAVNITHYSAGTPSEKTILVMPPTGGKTFLEKRYAADFCSAGFDVYIVEQWTNLSDPSSDLEVHQRNYARGQKAITLTLAQTKSRYVGILGTSLGGLHAAVAASYQPRLNSVFVITAGAPIAEVIVTSDQKAMHDLFDARKKRFGLTDQMEHLRAIEKVFDLEPMKLGDAFKTKTLGMAIATKDTTVPTEAQRKLENYWKPDTVIELSNNHFWGIINTWLFHSKDVRRFFVESSTAKN